jgi:hypothetical protein
MLHPQQTSLRLVTIKKKLANGRYIVETALGNTRLVDPGEIQMVAAIKRTRDPAKMADEDNLYT